MTKSSLARFLCLVVLLTAGFLLYTCFNHVTNTGWNSRGGDQPSKVMSMDGRVPISLHPGLAPIQSWSDSPHESGSRSWRREKQDVSAINSSGRDVTVGGNTTSGSRNQKWNRIMRNKTKERGDSFSSVYRQAGMNVRNSSLCQVKKLPDGLSAVEPLSQSAVEGVEKFVFFAGYPRSGHSMIGSVMDAHPNMAIAHEYFIFQKCKSMLRNRKNIFDDKLKLFNALSVNSFFTSKCGWRSDSSTDKGYNFNFDSQWQGTFSQLKVIGDKSGGTAGTLIRERDGKLCLQHMIDSLKIPVIAMHVIRNPHDMIATSVIYATHGFIDKFNNNITTSIKLDSSFMLQKKWAIEIFGHADTISKIKKQFDLTVVEIHIEDFIQDPSRIVMKLCHSLGVDCPQEYVDRVTAKAYKNISRSRDLISWSPSALTFIQQQIIKYPFFEGYTFEDSFRQSI